MKSVRKNIVPKEIEVDSLFAYLDQQTIFALLTTSYRALQVIYEALAEEEFEQVEDEYGRQAHNPDLRRLSCILLKNSIVVQRTVEETNKLEMNLRSALVHSLEDQIQARDLLLKIGNISDDFSVFRGLCSQSDLEKMLQNCTPAIVEQLDRASGSTPMCEDIEEIVWDPTQPAMTHASLSAYVTPEMLEEQVRSQTKTVERRTIELKMMNLEWFYTQGKGFYDFASVMSDNLGDDVYKSELVRTILALFWDGKQWKIVYRRLVPFVVMVFSNMWAFYMNLAKESLDRDNSLGENAMVSIAMISLFIVMYLELVQFRDTDSVWEYLGIWNILDWLSMLSCLFLDVCIISDTQWLDMAELRLIAALASCAMMLKSGDWLRLFEDTGFFIELLVQTLIDIRAFMYLMGIAFLTFGIPTMMLELNWTADGTQGFWGNMVKGVLYGQYLISLGEFPLDDWAGVKYQQMVLTFFVLSTFFVQITMLNMLIAIMGTTFEEVYSKKAIKSNKAKLKFVSEMASSSWVSMCKRKNSVKPQKQAFVFVAKPVVSELDEDEEENQAVLAEFEALRQFFEQR